MTAAAHIQFIRTDAHNPGFRLLVQALDADLAHRDGEDHRFYAQFNTISMLQHVVVAYENDEPVACGALKTMDEKSMEVKRMYTVPESRGKGIATKLLYELEQWAAALGYERCRLETGKRQAEAIQLYKKNGYSIIPNYGQYAGIENSICFEKKL